MSATNRIDPCELEEIYEMQAEELSLIEDEDVAGAMEIARKRDALVQKNLSGDLLEEQSRELVDKVKKLQELQNRISGMAKKLRDDLESELIRVRSENTRFNGYKQASRHTPLTNRFSKHG